MKWTGLSQPPLVLGVVLLILSGVPTGSARAGSDTHYQDLIIGERAAGMGGAFTALADEATGAYYNPAGIIAEHSTLIQLSMSAYKLRLREVTAAELCNQTLTDDQDSFFGFPGSFGFVKQLQTGAIQHGIGLTLVIPHAEKYLQTSVKEGFGCGPMTMGYIGSEIQVDRAFWGGLSYAIKPWRRFQAGFTLGMSLRSATFTSTTVMVFQDGVNSWTPNIDFLNGEVGLLNFFFQLGIIVEPLDGLRVGLSFTTPYLRLSGSGRLDLAHAESDPAAWESSGTLLLDDAQYYWKVPFKLALGLAYRREGRFTVALDVKLHGAVASYRVLEHPMLQESLLTNKRDLVVNVNLGGELFVGSKVILRLGLFTNLSSYPADRSTEDFDRINLFGFTAGGTLISSEYSALSLALQGQFGQGEVSAFRLTYVDDQYFVNNFNVDAQDFSLIITFGGSVDIH